MSRYEEVQQALRAAPRRWLVTGAGGFIGSHLVQRLIELDQTVIGVDNFLTGHRRNLEMVQASVPAGQWARFEFVEGDLRDLAVCRRVCTGAGVVLHQAALGSVPRSMSDPAATHDHNVTGFFHLLMAAREAGAGRLVYASSSSVYGDDPRIPKVESQIGIPLSPYAATKAINEIYARTFAQAYGLGSIGLRYFNVFGPRQDPEGAYAAVIPRWIADCLSGEPIYVNGDGETSRDFCYIENVVQANLLAATASAPEAVNQVYNVAVGERTTLNELLRSIRKLLPQTPPAKIVNRDFRAGDVAHSLADISKAREWLGYAPTHRLEQGLAEAMDWYRRHLG
jgi:UDP-N-acetylglucosamine/UDP-N-acetyl-alpha-D-glucosaminouronate 4-epimerase